MLSLKGLYEWKLTDTNGQTIKSGRQWNVVTDKMVDMAVGGQNPSGYTGLMAGGMRILLSDSVRDPLIEYREFGLSHDLFNVLASGGLSDYNYANETLQNIWTEYNFAPPVSLRTITIIGVSYEAGFSPPRPNFASFIELSVPITQDTNQYFYVKYTLFANYESGGLNVPANRYMDFFMNRSLIRGLPIAFYKESNRAFTPNDARWLTIDVTPFCQPRNVNNIMRYVQYKYKTEYTDVSVGNGVRLSKKIEVPLSVSSIPGVIGSVCQSLYAEFYASPYPLHYISMCVGYSPIDGFLYPEVSRVFAHPSNRLSQIFSDPAYPASSNGSIAISGIPDNRAPVITRINITKTGDASDIVDETVLLENIDADTNQFTVSQVWATGDKVRLYSSGMPTPLIADTDLYVIHDDDTHIRFADSLQHALDEVAIDLEDTGTDDVTLVRQNTAEFNLELENAGQGFSVSQFSMGVDAQNKVQPSSLISSDTGEGGIPYTSDYSLLVLGFVHLDLGEGGNSVISVQRSRVNQHLNLCTWEFWTIETSISLGEFGDENTDFRAILYDAPNGKIWIATNDGIYEYDLSSPSTPPYLITIAGLIDTDIRDMVQLGGHFFDDVRDTYVWTGHATGLTRINPSDLTCTKYLTSSGGELEGLTSGHENVKNGTMAISISASGYVRVLVGGRCMSAGENKLWVLDDGIGFYIISAYECSSAALRKHTNDIIIHSGSPATVSINTIVVTGKNSGTINTTGSVSAINKYNNFHKLQFQMHQVDDITFVFATVDVTVYTGVKFNFYKIGSGIIEQPIAPHPALLNYNNAPPEGWRYSITRHAFKLFIDAKQNAVDIPMTWWLQLVTPSVGNPTTLELDTDVGSWVKSRGLFPNTKLKSSNILINGLTAAANNAVGKEWDEQFIAGDRFTFMHGYTKFKDNLQTMLLRNVSYGVNAREITDSITIPNNNPSYYKVPESVIGDYPNFREVDNYDLVTIVKWGETRFTQLALPTEALFTVSANELTVGVNIATDTPIYVHVSNWRSGRLPYPLRYGGVYFAINVNTTKIKLSLTPGGAEINLVDVGIGTFYFQQVIPTTLKYFLGLNGVFVFAQDDIGYNVDLKYIVTDYN